MKRVVLRDQYANRGSILVHDDEFTQYEAQLAAAFLERWGMVAGAPDGEDSAGRQKGRMLSPDELVGRACAIAELATSTFRQRGWLVKGPSLEEVLGFE